MNQKPPDCSRPRVSSSVSRLSQYPPAKNSKFPREPHAQIRSRFGRSPVVATPVSGESQADKMGKFGFFSRLYNYLTTNNSAEKTLRYVKRERREGKEVIDIDSDDENRDDVFDESSIEEVENLHSVRNVRKGKHELNAIKVKKEEVALDSSVVSDVSNAIAKVDGGKKAGLSHLDQVPDDSGVPKYKRLWLDSEKGDDKRSDLEYNINVRKGKQGPVEIPQELNAIKVKKEEVLLDSSVVSNATEDLSSNPCSEDHSVDAILKRAAKTFAGRPSILKKRRCDLVSPLLEKRDEKKLEGSTRFSSLTNAIRGHV